MNGRLVFGMDIGGTRTKYGLIDLISHRIVAQMTTPTETGGQTAFVKAAGKVAGELSRRIGLRIGEISAGGVCVPGYVDGDQVSLVWESISFLEGITLRASLQEELGFPVRMDNDGRTAAMGEAYFGGHFSVSVVGRPRRLLSLTLGTGVGVALVVDGRLLEKSSINHLAGHIPIRLGGGSCFCGFSGCLESLVAGSALVRNFARFSQEQEGSQQPGIDACRIFELAAGDQPAAVQAVRLLIDDLVVGLNAYIYLYGPDVIVLGGGVANGLGTWLPLIRQGLFACPFEGYQVKVNLSSLGEQAGLYGAASLWES
jgi:predicted NBD/HSP70 family sugar kinase